MATEMERLLVSLEARTANFEKALERANAKTAKGMASIQKRLDQTQAATESAFTRMGAAMARIGAPAAIAGAALAGMATYVRQTASDVANLAAEAKRAGVAVEAFQEMKYAAEQSGVSVDALTDGLKEMSLRADEFVTTGKGSGAEAFQRLGYGADELKAKLKDPAALFEDVIARLRELNTSAQIRVSDEIFGGTGGEQFVRFLDQGRNGIARLRQEARDTGAVIDEGLVKQAQEVDRRFKALATTVDTQVKAAVLGLIDALRGFAAAFTSTVKASTDAPSLVLAKFQQEAAGIRAQIDEARKTSSFAVIGDLERRLADVERRATVASEAVREASRAAAVTGAGTVLPPDGAPLPPTRPQGLAGNGVDVAGMEAAAKAANDLATAYQNILGSARDRLANAQLELQTMGMTTAAASAYRFEQEAINQAARDNITLTPKQRSEIAALGQQYAVVEGQIEKAKTAQEQLNELKGAVSGFFSDMRNGLQQGKSAAEAFADAVGNLTNKLLDMLQNKLIEQLFKSFSFAGFSSGGSVGGGSIGLYSQGGAVKAATGGRIVGAGSGTSDSIPAMLSNGEYVVNAKAARRNAALLEAINSGTLRVPRAATGGSVGMPARGGGLGGGLQVNVINNAGADVQARETTVGGRRQLEILVEGAMNKAIVGGKVDKSNQARYGLGPSVVRRG